MSLTATIAEEALSFSISFSLIVSLHVPLTGNEVD
jgi:hypothetical protein